MRRMTQTFPASPEYVSRVRHDVESFLQGEVSATVRETAMLLVSELAANAVLHARSWFTVAAELSGRCLKVEVEDASRQLPVVLHPTASSISGRGMFMVEALSSRWGAEPTRGGKRVWFVLAFS